MADGLNTVPVLRMHLEELERVLGFVEGLLSAQSLQSQYTQMASVYKPTPLLRNVEQQIGRLQGYLQTEGDDEE
jgi:hypothetical protein